MVVAVGDEYAPIRGKNNIYWGIKACSSGAAICKAADAVTGIIRDGDTIVTNLANTVVVAVGDEYAAIDCIESYTPRL